MRIRRRNKVVRTLALLLLLLGMLASTARANDEEYDVVVAGSGPGGLVAAMSAVHELGQSSSPGHRKPRVLVVEKRGDAPPGSNFHDPESLQGSAFARDQIIGLKPSVLARLGEFGFRLPDSFRADVPASSSRRLRGKNLAVEMAEETSTHVISINELQWQLREHAKSMGVDFAFQTSLENMEPTENRDGVRLSVRGNDGRTRTLSASWLIGADGAGGVTSKLAGIPQEVIESQGVMVGAWFSGVGGKNQVRYQNLDQPGGGVLIGDQKQLYGLFALPKELGAKVAAARAERRPLGADEDAELRSYLLDVAKGLLPGADHPGLAVQRFLSFPVELRRARAAVSKRHRLLLIGDAVQTVNPYSGMGANLAMATALLVGDALRDSQGKTARAKRRIFGSYSQRALAAARNIHRISQGFRSAFDEVRVRQDRARTRGLAAMRVRRTEKREQRTPRLRRPVRAVRKIAAKR